MENKSNVKKKITKNIKKKINEFLLNEDGKISKATIIKTGAVLITVSEALSQDTFAVNSISKSGTKCVRHSSHSSHGSHGSHGSHASV